MKSDTGMQHLPSVLNDDFDDFHADAVLLCERLLNESLVKGVPQTFTISSTLVGSASRMTTNPRVKRRPCRPDCSMIPTCGSAKISTWFGFVITGGFCLHEEERRRLNTWDATSSATFMSQTMQTTTSSPDERTSQTCEIVGFNDNCLNQYREDWIHTPDGCTQSRSSLYSIIWA